jgi:hypothetical protein
MGILKLFFGAERPQWEQFHWRRTGSQPLVYGYPQVRRESAENSCCVNPRRGIHLSGPGHL